MTKLFFGLLCTLPFYLNNTYASNLSDPNSVTLKENRGFWSVSLTPASAASSPVVSASRGFFTRQFEIRDQNQNLFLRASENLFSRRSQITLVDQNQQPIGTLLENHHQVVFKDPAGNIVLRGNKRKSDDSVIVSFFNSNQDYVASVERKNLEAKVLVLDEKNKNLFQAVLSAYTAFDAQHDFNRRWYRKAAYWTVGIATTLAVSYYLSPPQTEKPILIYDSPLQSKDLKQWMESRTHTQFEAMSANEINDSTLSRLKDRVVFYVYNLITDRYHGYFDEKRVAKIQQTTPHFYMAFGRSSDKNNPVTQGVTPYPKAAATLEFRGLSGAPFEGDYLNQKNLNTLTQILADTQIRNPNAVERGFIATKNLFFRLIKD